MYSKKYNDINLGNHVFPIEKYRKIAERIIREKIASPSNFVEPEPEPDDFFLLAHTKEYMEDLNELRLTHRTMFSEMPLTKAIVDGFKLMACGSYQAAKISLDTKVAMHIGGGFHHAFPDHAEGFCYINDVALCIMGLKRDGLINRAIVIDCDLHQGNGTARIFRADKTVFTFSIHQENLYPVKEKSSLDIGLPDFTTDADYLWELKTHLPAIYKTHRPEFTVYVAGADPYKEDRLGSLMLTKEGLKERDKFVLSLAKENKTPVVILLAGGYAYNTDDTVEIHTNTAKIAKEIF